ncbi:hypothetical protein CDL15_Pgr005224 [Punica granatum]|uniref:Uncharacterized protein n=1 Tax=Punica granatum TaxID=22663 RepID=A0A218WP85_PUNGR|nr:hypothetical protein CDL15_Pgr005224 [Punica granatum]
MKEGHSTVVKLCDLLFQVYADNKMFDEAVGVYDFMESRGFEIDERSCMVCLLALKRFGTLEDCLALFERLQIDCYPKIADRLLP